MFANHGELRSLCATIGPQGVRVLDQVLQDEILRKMNYIKEIAQANYQHLKAICNNQGVASFYDTSNFKRAQEKLVRMDQFAKVAIEFGALMVLHENLRGALKDQVGKKLPFMAESVEQIHKRVLKTGTVSEPFNNLCQDFGISSTYSDMCLYTSLIVISKKVDNTDVWRYISLLFGLSVLQPVWHKAVFDVKRRALTNNGLCMAHAVRVLISMLRTASGHRAIVAEKEHFLRIAATGMIRRNADIAKRGEEPRADCYALLHYFVELDEDLDGGILEDLGVPFAGIRALYVKAQGDKDKAQHAVTTDQMVDDQEREELQALE